MSSEGRCVVITAMTYGVVAVHDADVVERIEEAAGLVRDRDALRQRLGQQRVDLIAFENRDHLVRGPIVNQFTLGHHREQVHHVGRATIRALVAPTNYPCARSRADASDPNRGDTSSRLMLLNPTRRINMLVAVLSLMSIILSSSSSTAVRAADRRHRTARPSRNLCRQRAALRDDRVRSAPLRADAKTSTITGTLIVDAAGITAPALYPMW